MTTKDVVARFCQQLAERLGSTKFGLWFEESATIGASPDGSLTIAVPTQFQADWIEKNFRSDLDTLANDLLNENSGEVVIEVHPTDRSNNPTGAMQATQDSNSVANHAHLPQSMREQRSSTLGAENIPHPDRWRRSDQSSASGQSGSNRFPADRFDPRYDLDQFITGQGNELAFHAALKLATGDITFSPLCIHGGCGLGKTHLLHGICRRYAQLHRSASVRYVTGEDFTNEYITAVRSGNLDAFRKRIRRYGLLAIDDVHFLSNKNATQKEFLCTLDTIGLAGARIVLASDNHPRNIDQFHQRLVSRLVSGMVVEVRMPDRETRRRIVSQLAFKRGIAINGAAVEVLADRCVGSIREIEGTLTRLQLMHELLHGRNTTTTANPYATNSNGIQSDSAEESPEIGLILVNRIFESQTSLPSRPIPVRRIVEEVSRRCGVTTEQVFGRSRHKRVVLARSLASYLARQMTTHSYPEIARALSKKNHSTVLAAVKRIETLVNDDAHVDLGLDERDVSIRYAVDSLRSAVLSNRTEKRWPAHGR